jgi:hypothetical protein
MSNVVFMDTLMFYISGGSILRLMDLVFWKFAEVVCLNVNILYKVRHSSTLDWVIFSSRPLLS